MYIILLILKFKFSEKHQIMNIRTLILFVFLPALSLQAQVKYEKYFQNKTLRYDFLLGGDHESVSVFPQQMKAEPHWAGSKNNLIDSFEYGTYRISVYDLESDQLIFRKGFSPLFMEWQSTEEAKRLKRTYYQSALIPYPKNKIRLEIEQRQWEGNFATIHSAGIDPKDIYIRHEIPVKYESKEILISGKPEKKIDLVFLAEGYTQQEMDKFLNDVERMKDYLFETEPFDKHKKDFNIYAILTPSQESGTDMPGKDIYKNTVFNSTFHTFGTPRYLTTSDMKNVYDAAANVPYDHIYILANTYRYGGGGFYNFMGISSVDDVLSEKVFVHEFGHSFAGLADEYYNTEVAYGDFYNLKVEPWEPNITTLVDFNSKWKDMLDKDTPIPTERIAKNKELLGVYEGGGYMNKGIYSPFINCRMRSNDVPYFCPACKRAIEKVIEAHIK